MHLYRIYNTWLLPHITIQPCICTEYKILGYLPISQFNHASIWNVQYLATSHATMHLYGIWLLTYITFNFYNIMMALICTDQYCIRPSAMLGLGQWVELCNLTMLGFPVWHWAKIIFRKKICLHYCSLALFFLLHLRSPLNALHSFLV